MSLPVHEQAPADVQQKEIDARELPEKDTSLKSINYQHWAENIGEAV